MRVKKKRAELAIELLSLPDRHTNLKSFIKACKIAKKMRLLNSREPKLEYIDNIIKETQERFL